MSDDPKRLCIRLADENLKPRWQKWSNVQDIPLTQLVKTAMDFYLANHNVKGVRIEPGSPVLDPDNEMCYSPDGQYVGFPGEELHYASPLNYDNDSNPFEGQNFSEWDEEE